MKKFDIKKIDVITNDRTLDYYENLLKRFPEYNAIKREIKLTNLLEGKRVQFEIDDIKNTGVLWGMLTDEPTIDPKLQDSCFDTKSMTFVLNGNKIEKLTIGITPLKTEKGKILESLIESDIEIEIREFSIENSILYFYVSLPKIAA